MGRLQSHRDFVAVLKRRRTVNRNDIVVHYLMRDDSLSGADAAPGGSARRLGLAVSKSVGCAVERNRVKRRFRALAREHEEQLPAGCDVVMRAKPSARHASYASLDEQVSSSFAAVSAKIAKATRQ